MPSPVDLAWLLQQLPRIAEGLKLLVDLGNALVVVAKLAKAIVRAIRSAWRRLRGRRTAVAPVPYRRRCGWRTLPARRPTGCWRRRR
jgi:hypothetical protein